MSESELGRAVSATAIQAPNLPSADAQVTGNESRVGNAEPVVSEMDCMDTAAGESMPKMDLAVEAEDGDGMTVESPGDSMPPVDVVLEEAGDGVGIAAMEVDGLDELTLVPHAIWASLPEDQQCGMRASVC